MSLLLARRGVIAAGGEAPAPFSPLDIANLEAWYDASQIEGLADGDPVAQWDDMSGNGRHLTQASSGLRPSYRTGVINGQPAVRFDGSDDVLTNTAVAAFFSGSAEFTMLGVLRHLTSDLNEFAIGVGRSSSATPAVAVGVASGSAHHRVFQRSDTNVTVNPTSTVASQTTGAFLLRRSGSTLEFAVNGETKVTATHGNATLDQFAIGALVRNTTGSWANTDVAEVLVYSRALDADEQGDLLTFIG